MKSKSNKLKLSDLKSEEIKNLSLVGGAKDPGETTVCFTVNWDGFFDGSLFGDGKKVNEFDS